VFDGVLLDVGIVLDQVAKDVVAVDCVLTRVEDVLMPEEVQVVGPRRHNLVRVLRKEDEKVPVLRLHVAGLGLVPVVTLHNLLALGTEVKLSDATTLGLDREIPNSELLGLSVEGKDDAQNDDNSR
jgi:hypothetical protein